MRSAKRLLKGDMATRFAAYKTALDGNFMQLDEVRYAEDLEPLGLNWVKLGLNDVLLDPATKQIYTPNTNKTATLGALPMDGGEENPLPAEETQETPLRGGGDGAILEQRGNGKRAVRGAKGRFEGSLPAPSPTGRNSLLVKGFKDKQARNNHWNSVHGRGHKEEYAGTNIKDEVAYEARAVELLEAEIDGANILGHLDRLGHIIRFDTRTGDYAKGSIEKGVFTMFKPDNPDEYYKAQRSDDLNHGGKI